MRQTISSLSLHGVGGSGSRLRLMWSILRRSRRLIRWGHEMKAKLLDLDGKYYGTEVEIFTNGDKSLGIVKIWLDDFVPSEREYVDEQDLKELYEDGMFSDSHHEDVSSYKVACLLVDAINNSKE
jgi:hypothetical protein